MIGTGRRGPLVFVTMLMISRVLAGVVGSIILVGTVVLVLKLLAMEPDAKVLLAGYMGIGGILVGAYLSFYAITGEWRPNLTSRRKES